MFGIFDSVQKIVYDGLELYFDAAQKVSYPGSGTNWADIAKGRYATINGNYAFNSANGGYLTDFNLNSTYAPVTMSPVSNLPGVTIQSIVRYTSGQYEDAKIFASNNSGTNVSLNTRFGGYEVAMSSDGGGRSAATSLTLNAWSFVSGVRDVSNLSVSIRVNDGARITNTYGSLGNVAIESPWMMSKNINGGAQLRGDLAVVLVYSRALTPSEELQNFYALRQRYGI